MTRRLTHALAALYALTAVGMLRCALISHGRGDVPHTLFFAGAAVLLATAIAHHAYHRDELRAALLRLERAARPTDRRPAIEDAVTIALAAACCETWWTSAGTAHDSDHCTRKDQTL